MKLKSLLLFLFCTLLFSIIQAQEFDERMSQETALIMIDEPAISNVETLVRAMQRKNRERWFDAFTFVQETIRFNKDGSPKDTSIWYEAIAYPDHFRIDYGDLADGNSSVFRRDSAYRFKAGELIKSSHDPQQFLLMKGGLYHYETKEVMDKLRAYGYNTKGFHASEWNSRPIWVLGAEAGDLDAPQFWIDAEHFYLLRRISKLKDGRLLDVHYGDHIYSDGGWVEQEVKFYLDGLYLQLEYYKEINTAPDLPKGFFDPGQFGKEHWYQSK